jgi:hypothetical protein
MAWEARPMPAPRIGQIGQKYHAPAVRPTAIQTVSTMTTIARYAPRWMRTPRRAARLARGLALRIVATKLRERQVGDELAQFAGGVSGERGLQSTLVLVEHEIALRQCLAQLGGGALTVVVAGANGRDGGCGHGLLRSWQ